MRSIFSLLVLTLLAIPALTAPAPQVQGASSCDAAIQSYRLTAQVVGDSDDPQMQQMLRDAEQRRNEACE